MQWLLLMSEFFIGGTKAALKRTDQRDVARCTKDTTLDTILELWQCF